MWKEGAIKINKSWFHYQLKVYDEPSEFGIDGGRISKVIITRKGETVCDYDRGWGTKPVDEDTEKALQILLFSEKN
jgi:hypothetical protein